MSKGSDFTKPGLRFRKGIFILIKILFSFNASAYYVLWVKFLQIFFMPLDYVFSLIEKLGLKRQDAREVPVIFVVGIQRTGSTLVSQFVENTFPFFPLGNFNSVFKRSGFYLHKWFSVLYKKSTNRYKNYYGISRGTFTIGDCYEVWDKWFGKNHYVIPPITKAGEMDSIYQYFTMLHRAYKQPILNKNNRNSLLIDLLNKLFPKSFFIIVKRDPVAVIRSTLKASEDFFGKADILWGLYPDTEFDTKQYENIIEAATVQYLMLESFMDKQIHDLDKSSYIEIDYDDFCANPRQFQITLSGKLSSKIDFNTADIVWKEDSFVHSTRLKSEHLDKQIRRYYEKWSKSI